MRLETAKAIVNAAEERGLEVRLYPNYSGRSRCGKTTAGVVGGRSDIIRAVASAANKLQQPEFEVFLADLGLSFDSLGNDSIAY